MGNTEIDLVCVQTQLNSIYYIELHVSTYLKSGLRLLKICNLVVFGQIGISFFFLLLAAQRDDIR